MRRIRTMVTNCSWGSERTHMMPGNDCLLPLGQEVISHILYIHSDSQSVKGNTLVGAVQLRLQQVT